MEEKEMQFCQLIAFAGDAKSSYIEAIHLAKQGKYDEAEEKINAAKQCFIQGHAIHFDLLQSKGEYDFTENLLLIHAEDQLSSAENFGIIADELIDLYKTIQK